MAEQINPYVSRLFDLANTFAVPMVQELAGDAPKATQSSTSAAASVLKERSDYALLNGSGPANPALANDSAPITLAGFISGGKGQTAKEVGTNYIAWVALIVAVVLLAMLPRWKS